MRTIFADLAVQVLDVERRIGLRVSRVGHRCIASGWMGECDRERSSLLASAPTSIRCKAVSDGFGVKGAQGERVMLLCCYLFLC